MKTIHRLHKEVINCEYPLITLIEDIEKQIRWQLIFHDDRKKFSIVYRIPDGFQYEVGTDRVKKDLLEAGYQVEVVGDYELKISVEYTCK